MVPAPKKAMQLGKVLKSAAKLPTKVTSGRGSGRADVLSPIQGEQPLVLLRVQVLGCKELAAKDRGGTSDPCVIGTSIFEVPSNTAHATEIRFVTVTLMNTKHQTPVSKKSVNPEYAAKDATFDFPIYMSQADKLGALELVVWDKDLLKKEYLGEIGLTLDGWFPNGNALPFNDANNKARLKSSKNDCLLTVFVC
jgi:phosphatidylserine decarboxylase